MSIKSMMHTTISSSVVPFSSCSQFPPGSGPFLVSQFFAWGGQIIRASAPASVLPRNIQDWFPLGCSGVISLQSKGLRVFSNTPVQKHQVFRTQLFVVQLSHPYMTSGKTTALTRQTFFSKVTSLLYNMLSRLLILFLPSEMLLLNHAKSLGLLASREEKFNLGPEIRLDRSGILCNKVLLK